MKCKILFPALVITVLNSYCLASGFTEVFKDKDGVSWSSELPKTYNGCVGPDGTSSEQFCSKYIRTAKDSAAQATCEAIGARLPTRKEVQKLIMNFDYKNTSYLSLTPQGLKQYRAAMKSSQDMFWTSTVSGLTLSDVFDQRFGSISSGMRFDVYPVRCVINPRDKELLSYNLDPNFEIQYGDRYLPAALITLADDSTITMDNIGWDEKSETPLKISKQLPSGEADESFSPDLIHFYTKPYYASWHKIRSAFLLRSGDFLVVQLSGYNGADAFRFSHIRKMNSQGKIDPKFGKKGVVAFEEHSSKLNYRYVGSLAEQNDGSILGIEYRCEPEGTSNFGQCEDYVFRLTPTGSFDKKFGTNGFVKISGKTTNDPIYRFVISDSLIGIYRIQEEQIAIGHLNLNGTLDLSFGTSGWKQLPLYAGRDCLLEKIKVRDSSMAIAARCKNSIRATKLNFNGDVESNFALSGRTWYDLVHPLENADFISAIGLNFLKTGKLFVSYSISNTTLPNNAVKFVGGQLIEQNGSLDQKWGELRYFIHDDLEFKVSPDTFFTSESSTGQVIFNLYERQDYSGLWLKTKSTY